MLQMGTGHRERQIGAMTEEQLRVVARFVRFMAELQRAMQVDAAERREWVVAHRTYWTKWDLSGELEYDEEVDW